MSNDLIQFVNSNEKAFNSSLTTDEITFEKEAQFAIQAFQTNSFLHKIAIQNQDSARAAVINVAAIGISLNPASKHAYLVPRKGAVCLDISYMGLLHLAVNSGSIFWGQAKIVHANDKFELQGLTKEPIHNHNPFGDRGAIVGAYCTVKTVDGDFLTETMSINDIYAIRNRSQAWITYTKDKTKTCPWVTDEGEMIKKTVVKRAYKYWPKSDRLNNAIDYLNNTDEGLMSDKPPVITEQMFQDEQNKRIEDEKQCFDNYIHLMNCADDENELKLAFADAYRKYKDDPLFSSYLRESQLSYQHNKQRLGV